jgi:hypothetical protein
MAKKSPQMISRQAAFPHRCYRPTGIRAEPSASCSGPSERKQNARRLDNALAARRTARNGGPISHFITSASPSGPARLRWHALHPLLDINGPVILTPSTAASVENALPPPQVLDIGGELVNRFGGAGQR